MGNIYIKLKTEKLVSRMRCFRGKKVVFLNVNKNNMPRKCVRQEG